MIRQSIIPLTWSIIVGVLCGIPGNTFPDLSFWKLLEFDSVAHAFVFMVFTFLWAVALSKQRNSEILKKNAVRISALTGIIYGAFIEIMQYFIFVRRSMEVSDIISDAFGCVMAMLLFRLIYGPVNGPRALIKG